MLGVFEEAKMIKVIGKAFDIMEHLGECAGKPAGLAEISNALDMHPATTANILLSLMNRQYVEQVAPRKGYLLGPAAYRLIAPGTYYRQDLVALVRPHLEELIQTVNETVLLSTLRKGARLTLCQIDSQRSIRVSPDFLFQENVYTSATGRLLLAYLSEVDLKGVLDHLGLPSQKWPEANTLNTLKKELAIIREQGWVCYKNHGGIRGIAFPITSATGHVSVALGLFLPDFRYKGQHRKAILSQMKAKALAISNVWPV